MVLKNDYELIYLYKNTQDDDIFQIMIQKYSPLIWKNIHQMYIEPKDYDDFYQEGIILLHQAMLTFDDTKNKTFTRYFELILVRRFVYLKNKTKSLILYPKPELFESVYEENFDSIQEPENLAPLEKKIYDNYFLEKKIVTTIAAELKISEKSVKNAIYRIKKKMK